MRTITFEWLPGEWLYTIRDGEVVDCILHHITVNIYGIHYVVWDDYFTDEDIGKKYFHSCSEARDYLERGR